MTDELAVCFNVPLVPVTVNCDVPVLVLNLVEIVSVEVPEPLTVLGLNVAVGAPPPPGSPLIASLTEPVKPFTAVIVTV